MKFTIEINLPIKRVSQLFSDSGNIKGWQKKLASLRHISGPPGEFGAVTELVYKTVTIIETITSKNSPYEIICSYEHIRGRKTRMIHKATYHFTSLKEDITLFEMKIEATKFIGFLPNLIMPLMNSAVKNHYRKQLYQFKAFAERAK